MIPSIKSRVAFLILMPLLAVNPGCSDDSVSPEPKPKPLALLVGMAYQDRGSHDLRYVEKTGEFWGNPEVVHYQGDQGWYASLVLDDRGTPHISYHTKNPPGDLMYAVRTENGWRRFTVDANGNTGNNTSIALDPQGKPHIVYQNSTTARVMYASYISAGNWKIEEVGGPDVTYWPMPCGRLEYGFPIPLAIDASGAPHISWVTNTITDDPCNGRDFAYATKLANGDWDIDIVDDTDCVGYCASIALDSKGNPHISYVDRGDDRIKFAWKTGDDWSKVAIATPYPVSDCRYPTSLALDARGAPHICYHAVNDDLVYVGKPAGGDWTFELVDSDGDVGRFCSIALDAHGNPHIGYWDRTNYDVKCAVRTNYGWAIAVVDNAPEVGWFTSIDLVYR